ncbi:MAG: transcriptional regulator [Desulfovibrionaceae bacterium]|nr:transcriptional regulator [Desulfovibrionaceae bacterium]
MIRLLLLIAVGYAVWTLFRHRKEKDAENIEVKTDPHTGNLVKDPVCGVYVDADGPIRVRDGEKLYVFCSYDCRDAFLKGLKK